MNEQTRTETIRTMPISEVQFDKDIDLEVLPSNRYEIHIKQEHYNFYFGITEVAFLAHNIMVAHPLPIVNPPGLGVYSTAEEAANSALAYLKKVMPDAEIIVSVKTE